MLLTRVVGLPLEKIPAQIQHTQWAFALRVQPERRRATDAALSRVGVIHNLFPRILQLPKGKVERAENRPKDRSSSPQCGWLQPAG